ncbi:hypothetical protein ACRE1U_03635 [Helicobacter himalayensis]|uniref:hypothetical protein n=1 Tax=Helicobacter himalayensis TaxID=1591088 RepID=UPI003D6E627B
MTLIIENVDEQYLGAFKAFTKALNAKCRVEKPQKKLSKFEKEILQAKKELQIAKNKGEAIVFDTHQSFKKAIENGQL